MTPLYTATASANSGRDGSVKSDDGVINMPLSVPKGLGGPGGAGTNPEQLFAAGYSACFGSALKLVAMRAKVDASQVTITAKVHIGKTADGGFGLEVELQGSAPNLTREQLNGLMDAAHQVCPYSRATRNNINVTLTAG